MAFVIEVVSSAARELAALPKADQRRVADLIDEQLAHQPLDETRNRKPLRMSETLFPFEHVPPVWELRVGDVRVYYDVDAGAAVVRVRAVRWKRPTNRPRSH